MRPNAASVELKKSKSAVTDAVLETAGKVVGGTRAGAGRAEGEGADTATGSLAAAADGGT